MIRSEGKSEGKVVPLQGKNIESHNWTNIHTDSMIL